MLLPHKPHLPPEVTRALSQRWLAGTIHTHLGGPKLDRLEQDQKGGIHCQILGTRVEATQDVKLVKPHHQSADLPNSTCTPPIQPLPQRPGGECPRGAQRLGSAEPSQLRSQCLNSCSPA